MVATPGGQQEVGDFRFAVQVVGVKGEATRTRASGSSVKRAWEASNRGRRALQLHIFGQRPRTIEGRTTSCPSEPLGRSQAVEQSGGSRVGHGQALAKVRSEVPETLEAAKTYGGNACKLNADLVEGWKAELRNLLHGRVEEVVLKEKIEFKRSLNSSLWEAWQKMSADPENVYRSRSGPGMVRRRA